MENSQNNYDQPGKDNSSSNNYRPILTSVSKIVEKIIHSKLTSFLNAIYTLPCYQFAFKSKHSTTQQVLRLTEHINNGFETKPTYGNSILGHS